MSDVIVLKFGSSVLREPADLPRAVDEIYRHVREGRRVVAVVSAFAGVTDRLMERAHQAGGGADPWAHAALVGSGETEAAAMLTLALSTHGVPARLLPPEQLALQAQGDPLDAEPFDVDDQTLIEHLRQVPVAVVPGFVAHDPSRRTVLLGRGGSDYTALFLAKRLGAPCVLLKDVDGLYERDPALPGPAPLRFAHATWDDALRVAGKLVQPKTIRFAHLHRQSFSVTCPGAADATVVGPGPSRLEAAACPAALKVVLLGLGTVGRGVYERLRAQPERFEVLRILVRDPARHVASGVPAGLLTADLREALAVQADVVIEALGGELPARSLLLQFLDRGARVVTANKAAVAPAWERFDPYAQGATPRLLASAAAGGAVPVLETLARLAAGGRRIRALRGVLNGTCNYLLDRLQQGSAFEEALAEAQALGFAEPDPTSDLSGLDVEHKLRLCAAVAFGGLPIDVYRQGLERPDAIPAASSGKRVRLIAELARASDRVVASIAPAALTDGDFLAGARGEENRIEIECEDGTVVRLAGRGAGRWPTTTAVIGDLWQFARDRQNAPAARPAALGRTG